MSTTLAPSTLLDACRTLLDTQPSHVQRLTNNPSSAVYRIRTARPPARSLIIKLYRGRVQWRAEREHEALNHIGSFPAEFSVPAVAGWGAVAGTDAIALITEDMGERLLHHAVQQGQVLHSTALKRVGELLAAFHQLPVYDSVVPAPALAQRLVSLTTRLPAPMRCAAAGALTSAINRVEERPAVLCHGDLHLHNIVAHRGANGPGAFAVIDFEETAPAIPEWDLAQAAVTTDACADADLEQLLAGYARPVDTGLLAHLIPVQCVRGWYYASRGEGRDGALWQRRLSRALSASRAPAP